MVLSAVDGLSDSDVEEAQPVPKTVKRLNLPRNGFKRRRVVETNTADPLKIRRLVSGRCGCLCQCFKPFQGSIQLFDSLIALRKKMEKMTKLEKDQYVST